LRTAKATFAPLLPNAAKDLKFTRASDSFPGGRAEGDDETSEQTARRETEEEIGHDRDRIEIIGELDSELDFHGLPRSAGRGNLRPPVNWKPQAGEVEKIAV
jgi:8-oxo-dGTP pyrophosphatase MutT (NUDIX family)